MPIISLETLKQRPNGTLALLTELALLNVPFLPVNLFSLLFQWPRWVPLSINNNPALALVPVFCGCIKTSCSMFSLLSSITLQWSLFASPGGFLLLNFLYCKWCYHFQLLNDVRSRSPLLMYVWSILWKHFPSSSICPCLWITSVFWFFFKLGILRNILNMMELNVSTNIHCCGKYLYINSIFSDNTLSQ